MEIKIRKTLVCSTSHYTENDDRILEELAAVCPGVQSTDAGFIIETDVPVSEGILLWMQLSTAFDRVMQLAASNDCDAVNFDRDAPEIEGLQSFEW